MKAEISSHSNYTEQTFTSLDLDKVQLRDCEFYDCTFIRCSFVESVFYHVRFIGCCFQHCDLSMFGVPNSTFSETQFEESKVVGVDWTQADWPLTRLGIPLAFSKCAISYSTFLGLNLRGIKIRDCVALEVDFREADLTRADLKGTDLSESMFGSTILIEADLSSARNYSIAPGQNTLKGARFSLPEAVSLLYNMGIVLVE